MADFIGLPKRLLSCAYNYCSQTRCCTRSTSTRTTNQWLYFSKLNFRSLVADYRARSVGDIITLIVTETVSAGKQNAASDTKTGQISAALTQFFGLNVSNMQAAEQSSIASADKASGSASYTLVGTIAVTVTDVLPNGNLAVSGEKQVGLDKGTEFIRVSGIIAPITIEAGNTVPSTKLSDARVEYRTNMQLDAAELAKSLGRIFSTVLLL